MKHAQELCDDVTMQPNVLRETYNVLSYAVIEIVSHDSRLVRQEPEEVDIRNDGEARAIATGFERLAPLCLPDTL